MNDFIIHGGLAVQQFYPLPNYTLAKGWALKGRLVGEIARKEIDSRFFADDGEGTWAMDWPGEETENLGSGRYTLLLIANSGDKELCVYQVEVRVFASTETDLRSESKKTLDALIAMRERKATRDEMSRSYNGRSISRLSWEDLLAAIDTLTREVRREQNAAAGRPRVKTVNYEF